MPSSRNRRNLTLCWACAVVAWALAATAATTLGGGIASDVTVAKKGTKITVTAGAGNEDLLVDVPLAGQIRILNRNGTVNASGSATTIAVGRSDTIEFSLGDGTDAIEVSGAFPAFRKLSVVCTGDDALTFTAATINAAVSVRGPGEGRVGVSCVSSSFNQGFSAIGVSDDGAWLVSSSNFAKTVKVVCGTGPDVVNIGNADFRGAVSVSGGDGDDRISVSGGPDFHKVLKISAGAGTNTVTVGACGLFAGAVVSGGGDGDAITLRQFTTLGAFTLKCGGGADTLSIESIDVRNNILLDGGPGSDTVTGLTSFQVSKPYRKQAKGFETNLPAN